MSTDHMDGDTCFMQAEKCSVCQKISTPFKDDEGKPECLTCFDKRVPEEKQK